jgi:hypothetical protein
MNPTWPGPCLLVPISVDALVLGTLDVNPDNFAQAGPDYTQLRFAKSPTPKAFQPATGVGVPQVGVQLHWNMPVGLRHGQTQSTGGTNADVAFPALPNRWLVIRAFTATGSAVGSAPVLSAWLIRSDVDSSDPASVPFPSETAPYYIYIGQPVALTQTTTDPASQVQRVFAMGPGEPSYAVVFQGTSSVLGFQDPLTGVGDGTLSYLAIGYYNPGQWDPLLGVTKAEPNGFISEDEWKALMKGLAYTVGDGSEADLAAAQAAWQTWAKANGVDPTSLPSAQQNLPAQMLLAGGVQQIDWKGPNTTYGSSVPSSASVQVAVGNTAVEAMAAWLNHEVPTSQHPNYSIERLVEALALDQINTFITDPVALEDAVQGDAFGSVAGGSTWVVARPDTGFGGNQQFQADQSVPLNETQTQDLIGLCSLQKTLNQITRALATRQWELFGTSWKATQIKSTSPYWAQVQSTLTSLSAQVKQLQTDQAATVASVTSAQAALTALLGADYTLSLASRQSFDLCTDPVVLVAGAQPDDTWLQVDSEGNPISLPSRLTGQTITAFTVTAGGVTAPLTATQLAAKLDLSFLGFAPLPKESQDLLLETLLLDPGVLAWLATTWIANGGTGASLSDAEAAISAIQQAVRSAPELDNTLTPSLVGAVLDVVGTPPDPVGNHCWAQPWCPLYLDWQLEWHPTSLTSDQALSAWQLGETDFTWTQSSVSSLSVSYTGRSLLNSSAPNVLAARITQFLSSPTGEALPIYQRNDLSSVAHALANSGVLTQSLSGFTDFLIQRALGRATGAVSDADSPDNAALPNPPLLPDESDSPFQPIRAGHFLIKKLQVVDAYGQVLQVQQTTGNVVPWRSEAVTTAGVGNEAYVQMPPRIAQSARVDLTLVSAEDDTIASDSSDATSSVCGYLVPSYLDGGLLVFDASGAALGQLLAVLKDNGKSGVRWDAAPGSVPKSMGQESEHPRIECQRDAPLGSLPKIANSHLLALVNGVLAAGRDDVNALDDLLALIDGASALTDPTWSSSGQLGALVGAPLAVVRATVQLELCGDPVYDQSYLDTGKCVTGGLPAVSFPARIGDLAIRANGVVGYYANDAYDVAYAAYGYSAQAAALLRARVGLPPYVSSGFVVENALLQLGPLLDTGSLDTGNATNPPAAIPLTVFMAPRGIVPAITGQQPIQAVALPPGPVTQALSAMALTFRAGPLLVHPSRVRMPLPADIKGDWALTWRDTVTSWTESGVTNDPPTAMLMRSPARLTEGWLELTGALIADSGG